MKSVATTTIFALMALLAEAQAEQCTSTSSVSNDAPAYLEALQTGDHPGKLKDLCQISVLKLHPTQFALGYYSMFRKVDEVKAEHDVDYYLKKNPEPIVIGPGGEFYIIDHHHLARALNEVGLKETYGIILENWRDLSENDFWARMHDHSWVYPVDEHGTARSFEELKLVQDVSFLVDDPYRSLAGETRCKKIENCTAQQWLKKGKIPFVEFMWAEHFRQTADVVQALKDFGDKNFDRAIQAAGDEVARLKGHLPPQQ